LAALDTATPACARPRRSPTNRDEPPTRQGDVWWAEAEDKRHPVLIVSRDIAAAHPNRVVVAPVTRTVRSIPTKIAFGADEGLDVECAASCDNQCPQPVVMLTQRIGRLDDARSRICTALAALADC
jgi:mRNA interferase MazF